MSALSLTADFPGLDSKDPVSIVSQVIRKVEPEGQLIRSQLNEDTIKRDYNRRIFTAERTFQKWRQIMGEHFQPAFDWALAYIPAVSSRGFDLTEVLGRSSLDAAATFLAQAFPHIFDGDYAGPELARFYREKAAKGVVYLANKKIKRRCSAHADKPAIMLPANLGKFGEPERENASLPQTSATRVAPDLPSPSEPWTLQVWSAHSGYVLFRVHMYHLWHKPQPEPTDVAIAPLRAECKAAGGVVGDDTRFVYVDHEGYNWPFYNDATLRTQYVHFVGEERSSTMYVYVEDRDPTTRGELLLPPWKWAFDAVTVSEESETAPNKMLDEAEVELPVIVDYF